MKNLFLVLLAMIVILFCNQSGLIAQVTNLKINGVSSNFTVAQGDTFKWEYNLPVGGSANGYFWLDLNANGVVDSVTDKMLFGGGGNNSLTQVDGQYNGNNGPGDMDSVANGHIIFILTNSGFPPAHYVVTFTNNGSGQSIAGVLTALSSPAFTISGNVTPPPSVSAQNIFIAAEQKNSGNDGGFWGAITDVSGNYTINFNAAAGGGQWRVQVNDQFPPYVITPTESVITLSGNVTGIDFAFSQPSAKVVGYLKGEDGHVFVGVEVRSNPQQNGGGGNKRATTDVNGFFQLGYTLSEINANPLWNLEANSDGIAPDYFPPRVGSISIHASDSLRVDLTAFVSDDSITGTITVGGHAPDNHSFMLYGSSQDSGQTRTNSDPLTGKFTLHVTKNIYNYYIGIESQTLPSGYGYDRNIPTAHPGNNNITINVARIGWLPQSSNMYDQLKSVSFANSTTGWVAGSNGNVLMTTDAGGTWTSQTTSTSANINGIYFVNNTTGWFVGDGGVIKMTTNGGTNWTSQNSTTTNDLRAIQFLDANNGWVVGGCSGPSIILKTTSGGSSWSALSPGIGICTSSISFLNANTGYAVGGSNDVYKTTDGGSNWSPQFISGCNLRSVFFINDTTGWVAGDCGNIWKTTDGGANWSSQSSGGCSYNSVFFINSTTGWAVGDCQNIMRTTNGGATWAYQINNADNYSFYAVRFVDASNGWVVGDNGTILHTTSGGVVGVRENKLSTLPTAFSLSQNYPNPFNPSTVIKFSLPKSSFVSLKVYNLLGQEIETLVNGERTAGEYSIEWNSKHLTSGVYFYRLTSGNNVQMKKMLLMK